MIFNAIGDANLCAAALQQAQTLLDRADRADRGVIHPPSRVLLTDRMHDAQRLGRLDAVIAPRIYQQEARAGMEEIYVLRSIALKPADSRVVNKHEREVGGFSACFGPLTRDHPLVLKAQPPVRTAIAFTCHLQLSGLARAYAGGSVVSSTLAPFIRKNQPATAHVRGYLSTSVVVIRLWRKPTT